MQGKKAEGDIHNDRILRIARETFLTKGYAATSMSEICAKLGGSKTTLYSRYASKKALFIAITKKENDKSMSRLFAFDEETSNLEDVLPTFCRRYMAAMMAEDTISFFRMIIAEAAKMPEIGRGSLSNSGEIGLVRMEAIIRKAMERGQLRKADPREAAELLLDLGIGYQSRTRLWNREKKVSPRAVRAQADKMMRIFYSVYGTDTSPLPH